MKTILITGASSGIGSAIAKELANEDCLVILTARGKIKLEQLKASLKGKAETVCADLSSQRGINELIENVKNKHASLDVLVNVAGMWHIGDKVLANTEYDKFDQKTIVDTLNVGTLAPMLLSHAFVPIMPAKGKIINISGTFESGAKGWLAYYVSKRAIEDLTVGLAADLKEKDIQVNCVSPSDTATEAYKKLFPEYINDAIDPKEVAKQVVFLCSSDADAITGKVFVVKKGQAPYEGFHT